MNKLHRFLIMLIAALMLLASGCGNAQSDPADDKPIALVIIAGRHANANMFVESQLKEARRLIERSIQQEEQSAGYTLRANVSIIVSDGNPELERLGDNLLTGVVSNSTEAEEVRGLLADGIERYICSDEMVANDAEVDLLEAIRLAKKTLQSEKELERHILILDTGITTEGFLNMREFEFMDEDVNELLTKLDDQIPNLTDINVTFLGLGNVAYPQNALSGNAAEKKLEDLWTGILKEKGHAILTDDIVFWASEGEPMMYNETPVEGFVNYPNVSPVMFPNMKDGHVVPPDVFTLSPKTSDNDEEDGQGDESKQTLAFALPDAYLGFKPNSAEFADVNQRNKTLNSIKEPLENYLNGTNNRIYIVGSIAKTAPDRDWHSHELSKARATAVRDALVNDYGVPADRLVIIDAGVTKFSWRDAEEFPGGKITKDTPLNQAKNRVVAIIGEDMTSLVEELRENHYLD